MKQIWIVEDGKGEQFMYNEILSTRYGITFFESAHDFFKQLDINKDNPDMIIIDLMLKDGSILNHPKIDSLMDIRIPYLMVSSVDEVDILQKCLDAGAYDYLTKPFNKNELIVKVERMLHESPAGAPKQLLKDVIIDVVNQTIKCRNLPSVHLTPREMQMINFICSQKTPTISRHSIITAVWDSVAVTSKTFDVHMHNLRNKIEPLGIKISLVANETYRLSCDWMN